MKRTIGFTLVATLVLLSALACQNTLSGSPDPFDPNLGRLTVTIASSVQAAEITTPDMVIASYAITLEGPGGPHEATVSAGTTSYTFFSLEPGDWTVAVDGFNAGLPGDLIGQGSASNSVAAGQRITVPVTVAPLGGPGTLDLSISWPADLYDSPEVVASLIPQGSVDGEPLLFTPGTNSATYGGLHDVGYYELSISLLDDDGVAAWSRRLSLRIVANLETTGSFALTATDITTGAIDVVISEQMNNPYSVSFTGFQTTLSNSQSMTVGVELDPIVAPDEVRWYLNGVLAETAATITIVAGSGVGELGPGSYWLDAIVTVGTTLSSYGQSFTVQ